MGDPRVGPTTFKDNLPSTPTVDGQISDVLNNPRMGENAKVAELEKIFTGLSDTDKQALYDRLKDRKSSDPIAKQFHYRLSHGKNGTVDRALKVLNPNHGASDASQTGKSVGSQAAKSADAGKAQAMDNKTFEAISRNRLAKEERKTDFGPEILVWSKDIMKTPAEKVEIIQKRLENASKDDLQKIMAESEKWPKESRDLVNEAMRKSPAVMGRIAKEFPPDEQLKILHRTLEKPNSFLDSKAMKAWMDNVSSDNLNHVMWNIQGQDEALLKLKFSQQINSSDFGAFNKLDPKFKAILLSQEHSNADRNPRALAQAFGQLDAGEKNKVFDTLQKLNPNALPDFLKDSAPHISNWMLKGLNKENAEFLRETYEFLAKNAKSDDLKELYGNNARFIKGWMEEAFKAK